MSKSITNLVIFGVGAAAGSFLTWKFLKTKYEKIAQEEIDSVKEVFSRNKERDYADVEPETDETKNEMMDYYKKLVNDKLKKNYSNPESEKENDGKEDNKNMGEPYVITPEEFGEFDDYTSISLTYFADRVLADDNFERIDDVEDIVGWDSLTRFGEYEEDTVYVRNDELKCDYEILRDNGAYAELLEAKPYLVQINE